jgi:UDP-glucuronate 4-epimerase
VSGNELIYNNNNKNIMNILVTGGAGFIGSNLIEKLLIENHNVFCIDNFDTFYDPLIKRQNIEQCLGKNNYTLIEGDIRDKIILNKIFAENEIELVIHLAARAGVRPSILEPELYYDVNVVGTLMLLEAMKAANVTRMIFASSSSVYGNNEKVPFSESDNVDFPISPYAATKKAGELLCHTYHHLYGFDIFCLRFFSVYGPRQRPEMAIHNFSSKILDDRPISVYGDGTSKRDYTFIEDILDGTVAAMYNLKGYEVINLGESKTYSLNTVIALLEKSLGKKAIINKLPFQPGDVQLTNADISKAKSLIGYGPKTNLEEGISKFVSWLLKDR